jgi:hypothetical protein
MPDPIEFFEERAAIIQFDGNRSRPDAEFAAAILMRRYCERMGIAEPKGHWTHGLPRHGVSWSDDDGKPVYVQEAYIPGQFRGKG